MDAGGYLAVLRRRWIAVVLCLLAGLAGGIYLGVAPAKIYQATARSFVSVPAGAQNLDAQLAGTELSAQFVATYTKIATSEQIAQRVVMLLHLPLSAGEVQGELSASPETGTFLIDITARDQDPTRAAALANAAAQELHLIAGSLASANNSVTVTTLDSANVPTSDVSPRPKLDLALGLLIGLVVGLALAALIEVLDRTVKTTAQVVALTNGAPPLGVLPKRRGGLGAATQDAAHDVASEAYRSLRTAVRFLDPDAPLRTILVTSASPGDGKSTTAGNLAISLARGGDRVIVVDCDLRRAGLGPFFGIESAVGVTSILRKQVKMRDALQTWAPNLQVLPAGPLPPNPAEILGSQAMAVLLDQLALEADVVVIDAPPVLPVTDAVVLATRVDGVVLVTRHGRTLRRSVTEATRRLTAVGADVVGFVLNGIPTSEAREYYVEYVYQQVPVPRRARPTPRADPASPTAKPESTSPRRR